MNSQRQPTHPRPTIRHRHRRRGVSYMFFLGVATLVTIIGLSALTVVRVKQRTAEAVGDRAAAQIYAQSAVEQALLAIYGNANWRNSIAHNTWSAPQPIGEGTLCWKLVDSINGALTVDRSARVRVYGKGVCGPATWVYGASVQPPPESLPRELLTNGNMESGTANWNSWNCNLVPSGGAHGGATCLLVDNRGSIDAEAYQFVTGSLENGATYYVEVWAKLQGGGADQLTLSLRLDTDTTWTLVVTAPTTVGSSWTKVTGTLTPTWDGTLVSAQLRAFTYPSGGTSDFYIDDARMTAVPGAVGVVPGTWRRETQ